MVRLCGFLIMAGIGPVMAIVGRWRYDAYLAAQRDYPEWKGALTGLAGPKGIAQIKNCELRCIF